MKRDIWKDSNSIVTAVEGYFSDQMDVTRVMNERIIERNLLYYCGEQYLEFVRSSATFRRRHLTDFMPTPVSNEIREFVRSVKAILMNQKLAPRVWPNTNEKEDIEAADLGENLLVWMDQNQDGRFFDEKEKLCIWLCVAGTAFMRTYPDMDGGAWLPDGSKTGEVTTETIMPFNVRLDTYGDTIDKKRWVGIQSLKDREWVEDVFKIKIESTEKNHANIDYQRKIATMISNVSPWKGTQPTYQMLDAVDDDTVLFQEVEFKPTVDYPMGRYVAVCGGKLLVQLDRLPITATPEWWAYSLTDFHFNYFPGRFWSDAPVSDLISPQNIINEIDQALSLNRKALGRPRVITAGDVGLKRLDAGGHGFLALSYNPIMGQQPKFEHGIPLPAQVIDERTLQKQQMQDIGGDPKQILRGSQPSANASGVVVQNMRETVEASKQPDVDRFNRSLNRVYKKRLLLAQEIYTEERLIKTTGRGNKVKVFKFKSSDLRHNTDVRLELDSSLLTTKSGQAETLISMIQSGFFKNEEISPTMRQEVLQRLGFSTFTDEIDADAERAEAENIAVASGMGGVMTTRVNEATGEQEVVTDDPLFTFDRHEIHWPVHRKFIISPEFKEIPLKCQAELIYHANLHKQKMEESKPTDIREYVQYDKLIPLLTQSERAQLLDQMGIQAGDEPMVGLPSADVVTKARTKLQDTEIREASKAREKVMDRTQDMQKHLITEGVKASAIQTKEKGQGLGRNQSKP